LNKYQIFCNFWINSWYFFVFILKKGKKYVKKFLS
jgi:hypothetical protein